MYNLITHKTNIKSTITKQIDITYKKGNSLFTGTPFPIFIRK